MTYLDHDYKAFPELTNAQLEVMQFSSPHTQVVGDFDAVVEKVTDGDTVSVHTSFRDFSFPIRLLDIDAPEMSEGGAVAKDWLKNRVEGRSVRVLVDFSNRVGKYGRLLGKIVVDGMVVNEELVHLGLVKPFGRKKEGEVPLIDKLLRSNQWF